MSKRRSLMDEVLERIPKKGFKPWNERIPPDLLAELEALRAAFWAGQMPTRTTRTGLSHAISKSLQGRGVHVGHAGVNRWLEKPEKA